MISKLEINVTPCFSRHWPELTVFFNNSIILREEIVEEKTLSLDLEHKQSNQLRIGLANKRFGQDNVWDTVVDHEGNILSDLSLTLNDVLVDDTSIIDILIKNRYYADNTPGQPENSKKINTNNTMYYNGFFEFDYQLPLLNSIINQKFKMPIDSEKSYFSNYTKVFHYDEELILIEEIKNILNETKKLSG